MRLKKLHLRPIIKTNNCRDMIQKIRLLFDLEKHLLDLNTDIIGKRYYVCTSDLKNGK